MGIGVERTFAVRASELRVLSGWWRAWAEAAGASPDVQDQGELVLNEAAANIVQHGRAREIHIALEATPTAVRATIRDDGPLFDPTRHPDRVMPALTDERRPSGLGIPLMHLHADVTYTRIRDENVLTLIFSR